MPFSKEKVCNNAVSSSIIGGIIGELLSIPCCKEGEKCQDNFPTLLMRGREIIRLADSSKKSDLEGRSMNNEKVYQMRFSKIYPLLVNKAVKKGRSKEEVDVIICWLTGYSQEELEENLDESVSYGDFFRNAPELNPDRILIKGTVCGIRVEEIEESLMREIRYLDKLIDELAKGKTMDQILRK